MTKKWDTYLPIIMSREDSDFYKRMREAEIDRRIAPVEKRISERDAKSSEALLEQLRSEFGSDLGEIREALDRLSVEQHYKEEERRKQRKFEELKERKKNTKTTKIRSMLEFYKLFQQVTYKGEGIHYSRLETGYCYSLEDIQNEAFDMEQAHRGVWSDGSDWITIKFEYKKPFKGRIFDEHGQFRPKGAVYVFELVEINAAITYKHYRTQSGGVPLFPYNGAKHNNSLKPIGGTCRLIFKVHKQWNKNLQTPHGPPRT